MSASAVGAPLHEASPAIRSAVWHALFWLVFANGVGVLIAILLLLPGLNRFLGEWTYGRWIMVHMNLELYGWTSLPLAGFLFKVYGADRLPLQRWCRPVLWAWSTALTVGAFSWLSGHSSGKLFLDWSGYARVLFPLAMIALWMLLANALGSGWNQAANRAAMVRAAKIAGLVLLLAVPVVIYIASSPSIYPAVNPDTGGPTGASQLESSLIVVAILLLLPFGLTRRATRHTHIVAIAWAVLIAEAILCAALGRTDISHHRPAQYLSLASLLVWIPITSAYYGAFEWRPSTRRWRNAFLWWWAALLISGWVLFLPGVLDHFKFTDGLVGHSFVAMAGFTSSLIIFVMVHLLDGDARIFNGTRAFLLWHVSVLGYVAVMTIAGWREGADPAFTIVPGMMRDNLYVLRLLAGVLMFIASLDWLIEATGMQSQPNATNVAMFQAQEKTA